MSDPTDDAEVAARLRRVILKLSRQLNASATSEGLTPAQASALGEIARSGPLGLAALTRTEHLNPTMTSRVVGHLDALGLIRRAPHPDDLRAATVEATAEGKAVHERIRAQRAAVVAECLRAMPGADRDAVVGALAGLETLAAELTGRA